MAPKATVRNKREERRRVESKIDFLSTGFGSRCTRLSLTVFQYKALGSLCPMSHIITVLLVSYSQITACVLTRAGAGFKSASSTWKTLAACQLLARQPGYSLQPASSIQRAQTRNQSLKIGPCCLLLENSPVSELDLKKLCAPAPLLQDQVASPSATFHLWATNVSEWAPFPLTESRISSEMNHGTNNQKKKKKKN